MKPLLYALYPILFVVQMVVGFVVGLNDQGWLGVFIMGSACWHIYLYAPYRIEHLERKKRGEAT
jgi:hypothetical protein